MAYYKNGKTVFMYNSQNITDRIKLRAKQQDKSLGTVLPSCGLGINIVSKISKETDSLLYKSKILKYNSPQRLINQYGYRQRQ